MSSFEFLSIFYGISILAVVLLLVRYFRRRRRESQTDPNQQPASMASADSSEPSAETTEDGGDREAVVDRRDEAVWRPVPSSMAKSNRQISWERRRLFDEGDFLPVRNDNDLPHFEASDIPDGDTSDYWFGPLTPVLASLVPALSYREEMFKQELRGAGFYEPHAWHNLTALRYLMIMGPLVFCSLLLVLLPPRWEGILIVQLAVLPLLGWALPRLYVKNLAASRLSQIEQALPDMIDMLNMCVSQGLTVQESLRRIEGELKSVAPALGQELRIVCEQAELGTLPQALENLSGRIESPELHSLTSLLIQTERMGTSISAALIDYSDSMRESMRQRADEKANQASFRLLFPTAFCLMPAVFMFLLGPSIVELSDFFGRGGVGGLNSNRQTQRIDAR